MFYVFKDNSWQQVDPYVFKDNSWQQMTPYIFNNNSWIGSIVFNPPNVTINSSPLTIDFDNAQPISPTIGNDWTDNVYTQSLPQDPGDLRYISLLDYYYFIAGINDSGVYFWYPTSSEDYTLHSPAILNVDTSNLDNRVNIGYTHYMLHSTSNSSVFKFEWVDWASLNGTNNISSASDVDVNNCFLLLQQKSSDLFLIYAYIDGQPMQTINKLNSNVKSLKVSYDFTTNLIQHTDLSLSVLFFSSSDSSSNSVIYDYVKLDGLPLDIDFDNIYVDENRIISFNYNNKLYLVDSSNGEIKYLDSFKQFNYLYFIKNLTNNNYYFIDAINITSLSSITLHPINIPDQNYLTLYGESDHLLYYIMLH